MAIGGGKPLKKVLEVSKLEKYYGGRGIYRALDGVSFSVNEGEFVGVMGPSGAGKTTLLHLIATIDKPSAGNIIVDGEDICRLAKKNLAKFRRDKLGFVFQDYNLLDTLTLQENIALALTIGGENPERVEAKVTEVASRLGIDRLLDKFPSQVSGGEKQRTAAARAIVTNPALVLADEPTGALDSRSSQMLLESFTDLNQQLNATILMVSHDPFVASYCRRIIFLRDGKIFAELNRGTDNRKKFFDRIIESMSLWGGENEDVC